NCQIKIFLPTMWQSYPEPIRGKANTTTRWSRIIKTYMPFRTIAREALKAIKIFTLIFNFPEVFLHILFRRPLLEIRLRSGVVIKSPQNVQLWNHFNDIWLNETYTSNGFDIKSGSIVVDVGANIGLFSLYASKYATKVYSFEPFEPIFNYLSDNLRSNSRSNCSIENVALGEVSGNQALFLHKESTANSLLNVSQEECELVNIACVTIKEAFDANDIKYCDFLKLDCE